MVIAAWRDPYDTSKTKTKKLDRDGDGAHRHRRARMMYTVGA